MMSWEMLWDYDACFSALTRAMEPPVAVGAPLDHVNGAVGLMYVHPDVDAKMFDPEGMALGLHPKTAVRFKDVYNKEVPEQRMTSARKWLEDHNAFHIGQEDSKLAREVHTYMHTCTHTDTY